jgi:predicted AAA+ superfamily ATPase
MLWNSIPTQLSKENKKFIYGQIKEGARAKDYELALLWLCDCGLVSKVHRLTTPKLPLKAYEDLKAFKLFLVDVGLLSCMAGLRQQTLLDGNTLFKEFKGALTEQYVFEQLKTRKDISIHYWTNERNSAEIDFIISNGNDVIPLEVKAEINLQAKSLKTYREKFSPPLSLRTSMADYKSDGSLIDLPLYALEMVEELT